MKKNRQSRPQRTNLSVQLEQQAPRRKFTLYFEDVNNLPAAYATDNIIADADMDIMNFMQPAGQSTVEYAQALGTNVLHGVPFCNYYRLEGTFIEWVRKSI